MPIVKVTMSKDFKNAMKSLHARGGRFSTAAQGLNRIFIRATEGDVELEELFYGIPVTNHGENRIKKCVKYDLTGHCRCITIQDSGVVHLAFAGTHSECDKWLKANRGYTLAHDRGELVVIHAPKVVEGPRPGSEDRPYSEGSLLDKLKGRYHDAIADAVSGRQYRVMAELDSMCSDDDIWAVVQMGGDEKTMDMVMEVLRCLREDNVDAAKDRILYFEDAIRQLDDVEIGETDLKSNDQVILLEDFGTREISRLFELPWKDWMLFMHPQQKVVVDADFNGPARLLGVSGSGKTCVVVNRAIRLANKYPGEKVLITTINEALASLIRELVMEAVAIEQMREDLLERIEVKSLWQVSRELILEHESDPLIRKSLDQYTEKVGEDVDEIWSEFYRRENNNDDSRVFEPVHKALIGRGVLPMRYIKDEFDFIRSAVSASDREAYLDLERKGRQVMLQREQRQMLLEGLKKWEEKLEAVGVSDYLGMMKYLSPHMEKVEARYRCVLVDELQDFGTSELSLVRRLVADGENDLFMCGDVAQVVHVKQHKPRDAGIEVIPRNYLTITKNYRNSREILEAASLMFEANTSEEYRVQHEGDLLSPEMANFSSHKPLIMQSASMEDELSHALTYLDETLVEGEIGCVAVAGMSFFDVEDLGRTLGVPVLDGRITTISEQRVFLSDLEQTKGFEFDRVIVVGCTEGTFPNPLLPDDEVFREVSKLYVSMTRAKKELIISHSGALSAMFEECIEAFGQGVSWDAHLDGDARFSVELEEVESDLKLRGMTGFEYSCTKHAVGLSSESCDRLITKVNGSRTIGPGGAPDEWINMGDFMGTLANSRLRPQLNRNLGQSRFKELLRHFNLQ